MTAQRWVILSFLMLLSLASMAHNAATEKKFTISGYVQEAETGEYLFGATVLVKELAKGAATNEYGFYSITLPEGTYTLAVSFVGYKTQEQQVILTGNRELNVELQSNAIITDAVTITGEASDVNTQSTDMGKVTMDVEKAKSIPALLGEVDILKTLQLMPGVQSGGEGNSGFYVRGGGPDQNLILLDEAVVYNASHLFGFFLGVQCRCGEQH